MPNWKKVITSGSDAVLNSVTATTGFTGSLLGTASYATNAISASYAPAGNPFPYNGNAQISGSLGVTGSFAVQTYDGIFANAFVDAIRISDGGRAIYDIFGTGSIDAGGRVLIDNMFLPSLGWLTRTMFDGTANSSIDWNTRIAYDATGTTYAIDWGNRSALDGGGIQSISWDSRGLIDEAGTDALNWDVISNNYKIATSTYLKKLISTGTQELFSDVPTVSFNYEGEVIGGQLDGTVAQFDLVYLETDGKWYPVTQATTDCSKLLGICALTGVKPEIILEGSITVNDGSGIDTPQVQLIDHGLPIYIRESAGNTMSTNVPTTAGQYVRILGHAYYQNIGTPENWVMKFRPSNEWYVI
jgi:hypothetical protein